MVKLICPVCSSPLHLLETGKSWQCDNRHLFDRAKQGYINLLLNQHKKSKAPGDSAEMIQARSDFLNAGYYSAIVDAITNLPFEQHLNPNKNTPLYYCDIACGEGYYTLALHSSMHSALHERGITSSGIDISTPAIKAACRRSKDLTWIVGNAASIPLASESQDLASCLFCRVDYAEAKRIITPGGLFLVVQTGPSHLLELRKHIYQELKSAPYNTPKKSVPIGFELVEQRDVHEHIEVETGEMLINLLKMTPHYWRSNADSKARLSALDKLDIQIDVQLKLFRKVIA